MYQYVPPQPAKRYKNFTVTSQLPDFDLNFILLDSLDELFILMKEEDGYIFRDINKKRFGHSGTHETVQGAIERALTFMGVKIFYGESLTKLLNQFNK